jgi:hypothetical protein
MNLADELREVFIRAGACPETATELACDIEAAANNRIARDKRDLDALQSLHLGAEKIARENNRHRSTMYRRAERARKKLSRFSQHHATNPA